MGGMRAGGGRTARILVLGLLLLAAGGLRRATAAPEADAARAYLAAVAEKGREAAWRALEAADEDPWVVVEALLGLGEPAAAAELAGAPLTADAADLQAYVARAPAPAPDLPEAVARAEAALAEARAADALELLSAAPPGDLTVTGVRARLARARALDALARRDEAGHAYEDAALHAEALGWSRAETDARRAALAAMAEDPVDPAPADLAGAQRHLERLLAIDRDARDLARSAGWCERLGTIALHELNLRTARRRLEEAESLLAVLAQSPGLTPAQAAVRVRTLCALAHVHALQARPAAGLDTALRARELARGLDVSSRIRAAHELGDAYRPLQRQEDAIAQLQEALALSEAHRGADALETMRLVGSLARLRLETGDTEGARELYRRVVAAEAVRAVPRTHFVARIHLAALEIDRAPEERTVEGLQRATLALSEIERDVDRAPSDFTAAAEIRANARALRGRALNLLGRYAAAEADLRRVIESDYAAQVPSMGRYARQELVRALRMGGNAQAAYTLARETLDDLRASLAGLPDDMALHTMAQPGLADFVREYAACAREPEALREAIESTRGIAYLAEARRRRRSKRTHSTVAEARSVEVLAADVGAAARRYWSAKRRGDLAVTRAAGEALWQARVRLRAVEERADLARTVRAAPGVGAARPTRSALVAGEAMLHFAEIGDDYAAVVVRDGRTRRFDLGTRAALDATLTEALAAWIGDDAAAVRAKAAATLLDTTMPAALVAHLRAEGSGGALQHVYVAAAGVFARLPWPALVPGALARAGMAADALPGVSRIASEGVLADVRHWNLRSGDGPILFVADPQYRTSGPRSREVAYFGAPLARLPETATEARAIADPERGDVMLLGTDASEPAVEAALQAGEYPFAVLHLACHGLLYREVPWLSALALHPAPGEDGLLTVDELGDWEFLRGPALVVLSACESGLGAPVPGEGEEGLVRAFLLAGTRHVVASLWKVPDGPSRDLMVAFHRARRAGGLGPVEALARAQAELRARPESHPRDWAAWVVWGPRR